MEKLNMANMNTLFRKGYLLAGVVMAANMFAVNEVKAVDKINEEKENEKNTFTQVLDMASGFVLSLENTINLVGGVVFSVANNYLKLWDYNPGGYFKLGCLGWRSSRLINIFQIGINLNLGRGILWLIPGTYNLIKFFTVDAKKNEEYVKPLYFSCLVADRVDGLFKKEKDFLTIIVLIGVFLVQGFVSVPLAIHISNFSISISLDSMLWAGIGEKNKEEEGKGGKGTKVYGLEDIEDIKPKEE